MDQCIPGLLLFVFLTLLVQTIAAGVNEFIAYWAYLPTRAPIQLP